MYDGEKIFPLFRIDEEREISESLFVLSLRCRCDFPIHMQCALDLSSCTPKRALEVCGLGDFIVTEERKNIERKVYIEALPFFFSFFISLYIYYYFIHFFSFVVFLFSGAHTLLLFLFLVFSLCLSLSLFSSFSGPNIDILLFSFLFSFFFFSRTEWYAERWSNNERLRLTEDVLFFSFLFIRLCRKISIRFYCVWMRVFVIVCNISLHPIFFRENICTWIRKTAHWRAWKMRKEKKGKHIELFFILVYKEKSHLFFQFPRYAFLRVTFCNHLQFHLEHLVHDCK